MANTIVDQFNDIMDAYLADVIGIVEETAEEVGKEALAKLKSAGGYENHRGKYRRNLRLKKTGSAIAPKVTLYAAGQEYRLTHLLENGHAIDNGTARTGSTSATATSSRIATEAFPHWSEADAFIKAQYESRVGKKIEKLG